MPFLRHIVFKSLFSKETEASNAVLRFLIASVTNQKVTKVKVLNPEITPDIITGKRVVLDVRCEFNNGLQADVEMQKADEGKGYDLLKRMTAYNASQISSQMGKGEQWNELNTCYQINNYSAKDGASMISKFIPRVCLQTR